MKQDLFAEFVLSRQTWKDQEKVPGDGESLSTRSTVLSSFVLDTCISILHNVHTYVDYAHTTFAKSK